MLFAVFPIAFHNYSQEYSSEEKYTGIKVEHEIEEINPAHVIGRNDDVLQ